MEMVDGEIELIKGIEDHIKLIKAQLFLIFPQNDKYKVSYIQWVGVGGAGWGKGWLMVRSNSLKV